MLRVPLRGVLQAHIRSTRWQLCNRVHRPLIRRGLASVTDLNQYPQPGENIHGFTLKRTKHVPELQLTAFHLVHDNTGAEYLHIARDDKNNVFSVGFKTNPPDDTGVPHILEPTTLCGSQKYVPTAIDFYLADRKLDILSGTHSSRCCLDHCPTL